MCRPRSQNFKRQARQRGSSSPAREGEQASSESGTGELPGNGQSPRTVPPAEITYWQRWEEPAESSIWQSAAFLFITLAATATFAALTLARSVNIRASELWICAGGFAALALTCSLAHWDVNRGRRGKRYKTEARQGSEDDLG